MQKNVLFICKLNPVTTGEDLEIIFSRFGPIKSCEVIRDWKTGESLCYAFIEFEKEEDCEKAYFKMDNVLIDDRRIHVDFSHSVTIPPGSSRLSPRVRCPQEMPSHCVYPKCLSVTRYPSPPPGIFHPGSRAIGRRPGTLHLSVLHWMYPRTPLPSSPPWRYPIGCPSFPLSCT
uniref:peptidylprolyl isomerase n=1 Tax=Taeniopygia guttata TaxID=59729 RepID=A0A674H672_TAEGU